MTGELRILDDIDDARRAWRQGNWVHSRNAARKGLAHAVACRDTQAEARASLLLAHVLTLESRFSWARVFATKARVLFSASHNAAGMCEASLALSYVGSALGSDEEALRWAEEVVAGVRGAPRRGAAGLNYRGLAAAWLGEYDEARRVFDASRRLASQEVGTGSCFQPLSNAVLAEVLRYAEMRMRGQPIRLVELADLVSDARALVSASYAGSLVSSSPEPGLLLLDFADCIVATGTGDAAEADRHYLACVQRASRLPITSWMQTLVWWARLERATAERDAAQAAASAAALASWAESGEHVHMRRFAGRLVAEAKGRMAGARRRRASA